MRLWLVIVFAAAIIGSGVIDSGSDGGRVDLASKVILLGEAAEEALADPLSQTLSASFVGALAHAALDTQPAPQRDSRQTNRHQQRSDLHRLKRVFLI